MSWVEGIDLAEVKAIGRQHQSTVNDAGLVVEAIDEMSAQRD